MAISTSLIGNLLGRHLKNDPGLQGYNADTGRGYIFSADGRVGFFVDFDASGGPRMGVGFYANGAITANWLNSTVNGFINKTTGYDLQATDPTPTTDTKSLFYNATRGDVGGFDKIGLGSVLTNASLTKFDFSNMAMLVETWTQGMLANVRSSTMLPNSGIRGIISGDAFGFRAFKSGSEGTAGMTDNGESVFFTNPDALTSAQLQSTLDGKKGFDYITLVTSSSAVALKPLVVNFSNMAAQTITENGKTLKVANFEGIDLGDGNDRFVGFNGDNTVWAGKGNDTIDGGGISNVDGNGGSTDRDWVTYANGGGNKEDKGIVLSTNSSGVMSVIDYGGATDTLTNVEAVHGTWLNDRFSGGTGIFNQIFSGLKGADTIDGGTGRDDRVWHHDDPAGVVVNLSSAAVNTRSVEALVKSVKYAGASDVGPLLMIKEALDGVDTPAKVVASNRALDGWGTTDVLTSIEAAQGSQYDDQLYGSNARNLLIGCAGFDFIVGNGGDDYLYGGYGNDVLHGGLGRDWLIMDELKWGALSNNYSARYDRDTVDEGNLVVYKSVNESGLGLKADVLDGFILDNDLLDLSAIDANTKRAGNQQFDTTIITTNFTNKAGQLKISAFTGMVDNHNYSVSNAATGYKLNGVELQGDVNGDGMADFGIRLVGADFNVTDTNTLSVIASRLSITDNSILF